MIASGVSTMFQISTMSTWAVVQNWHSFAAEAVMITSSLMRRSSSPPGYTDAPKPAKARRISGRRHIAWSISTGAWPRSHRPRLSSNDGSSLTASKADSICSEVTETRTDGLLAEAHCTETDAPAVDSDGGRECVRRRLTWSSGEHLAELRRELDRLAGRLAVLAAHEPAVIAGELDRLRAEALCGRLAAALGEVAVGLIADGQDDPCRRPLQRVEVRLVGRQVPHVVREHQVRPNA